MSWDYLSSAFEKKGTDATLAEMLGEPQRGGYGAPGASPIRFADQAALDATMREFGDDRSGVDWVLIDYQGDNVLKITKKGSGVGVPPREVQNDIDDNKIQFLLMTIVQGSRQYGLWRWVGAKAPAALQKTSEGHMRHLHQMLAELMMKYHKTQLLSGELRA